MALTILSLIGIYIVQASAQLYGMPPGFPMFTGPPWAQLQGFFSGMIPPLPPPPPPPPPLPPPFPPPPYYRRHHFPFYPPPPYPPPPYPPPPYSPPSYRYPPPPYSSSPYPLSYNWESGIRVPGYPYYYSGYNYTASPYSYDDSTTAIPLATAAYQTDRPTTTYSYPSTHFTTITAPIATIAATQKSPTTTYSYPVIQTTPATSFPTLITYQSTHNIYTYSHTTPATPAPTSDMRKAPASEELEGEPISIVPIAEDAQFQRFLSTGKNEKLTTEGKKRKSPKDGKWESLLEDHDTGDINQSVIKKPPPLPDLVEMKQPPDDGFRRRLRKW